jgi:hypothetical protein
MPKGVRLPCAHMNSRPSTNPFDPANTLEARRVLENLAACLPRNWPPAARPLDVWMRHPRSVDRAGDLVEPLDLPRRGGKPQLPKVASDLA